MKDKFLDEFTQKSIQVNETVSNATNAVSKKAFNFLKERAIDIILVLIICFVQNVFDVFILQKSTKIGEVSYWYKVMCRVISYTCASILGLRFGMPLARQMPELLKAIEEHDRLMSNIDSKFTAFLDVVINRESKINAWKWKIKKALKKLDSKTPNSIIVYYNDGNIEHFGDVTEKKLKKLKKQAKSYETRRKNLESMLTDKYIEDNINSLNCRYYRVKDSDFNGGTNGSEDYTHYTTRAKTKQKSTFDIGKAVLFTLGASALMGCISISFDEELAKKEAIEFVTSIMTIIINCLLDTGMTIWKFISSYMKTPKIIKDEELTTTLDRVKILKRYYEYSNNTITEKSSTTE